MSEWKPKTEDPGCVLAGCIASITLLREAFDRRDKARARNATAEGYRFDVEMSGENFEREATRMERSLEALRQQVSRPG